MARLVVLLVCLAACGNITRKNDGDAGVRDDAKLIDASMITDAGVDAPLAVTPARELLPGGVRMNGSTYTMEAQLGHPIEQKKATGATYTIQGNAAVKR